jgi:hypothetical protein
VAIPVVAVVLAAVVKLAQKDLTTKGQPNRLPFCHYENEGFKRERPFL